MNEIMSRGEFEEDLKRWENLDPEPDGGDWLTEVIAEGRKRDATVQALATALNAHPENPAELQEHEDLVDMLTEMGWIDHA